MSIIKCAALNLKNIRQTLEHNNKDLYDLLNIRQINRTIKGGFDRLEHGQKVNEAFGSLRGKVNAMVNAR